MENKTLTIKDICDGYTTNSGLTAIGSGVSYDPSVANKLIIHEELDDYGAVSGEDSSKAKKVVSNHDSFGILDAFTMTIKIDSINWASTWDSLILTVKDDDNNILASIQLYDSSPTSFVITYPRTSEGGTINYLANARGSGSIVNAAHVQVLELSTFSYHKTSRIRIYY